jgi:PAS domain S-box-containing protein
MVIAELFIPHGHCYLWKPGLVGLHLISDGLTALAYYSIPLTLTYFVIKRRDVPFTFNWIFLLFSAFIISCGTTHIINIWTLWHPNYWLSGCIKAFTAFVSLYTAGELVKLLPTALTIPSTAQLEAEIRERQKAEAALLQEKTHLAQAQKVAHVGSWEFDIATQDITWSDETFRIYGFKLGQPTPTLTEHWQIIHPDDRIKWSTTVHQLVAGKSSELEFRIVRPDGSIRHLLGQGEPIFNPDSQVYKLFGTVLDITDRIAAQQQDRLVGEIALEIHQSLELDEILNTTVREVRQFLASDRVLIYRFNPDWSGLVLVESVGEGLVAVRDSTIYDPCFSQNCAQFYQQGRICAIANIDTAHLHPCYLELLASLNVTAYLIVPILVGEKLWGLLIVHHCRGERQWQSNEIGLLQKLATQVAIAIQQAELYSRVQSELIERQRIEQELRVSEERYRSVVTAMSEGVVLQQADGQITACNASAERILGLSTQQMLGFTSVNPYWQTIYEDGSPFPGELHPAMVTLRTGKPQSNVVMGIRKPNGRLTWISINSQPLCQPGETKADAVVTSFSDITDRKMAEATLQEAERRWRSLLENVQLLVVGLDSMGNVEYINPFFLNLTGYTRAEVVGKNWFENFLPPSCQQQVNTIFPEDLEHNFYTHYTNPILTQSGEERLIAWNNTLLRDAEGTIVGTMSIGEDITQRQEIERIKNEFISIVSHELRTPLTAIRGSLGLLATGVYDNKPEKAKRMVEIALTDSDRLVRLVNDMLDLERLDSGKVSLHKEVCDVAALMQQAANAVQAIADSARISISIIPLEAHVWAAPDSIIQTLTNLLSNAIKFSASDTTITLTAKPQPDYVLFQVKDQGRGIPADKLETIFERFQQVNVSDSRQKGGTGLGLAICQSIVEQHEGRIWVESTLGEGSTFYFTLPAWVEQ